LKTAGAFNLAVAALIDVGTHCVLLRFEQLHLGFTQATLGVAQKKFSLSPAL
jgi:hypothetical protein